METEGADVPGAAAAHARRGSGDLRLAAAGQGQELGGDLPGSSHGETSKRRSAQKSRARFRWETPRKATAASHDRRFTSSLRIVMKQQSVEPTTDGGGGREPGRDREARWQRLPDLRGEGGGELGGEEPHVEPGVVARRRPVRRDLEAAERAEEQAQVQVGDANEGGCAASPDQVPRRTGSAPAQDHVPDQVPVQEFDVNGDGFGLDHLGANASSDNTTAASARSSADPFGLISEAIVNRVWRENCDEAFTRVVDKLHQPRRHLYIALDLEFVAGASTNRPICWNSWYDNLRTLVNGGEMLQVGLVLAFDLDHQHGGAQAPSSVIALEINLMVDVDAREFNAASVAFLADHGHCLTDYRDRGVTTEQLLNGLLRHIPFGDDSVTWVTFHGDGDFGFLLPLLLHQQGRGGVLPPDRAAFMRQVRQQFPAFYDVRVLGQLEKEGFTGSLKDLAACLGVRRIGGEHHAGSDALLTLSCFEEIRHRNEHKPHRLHSRQCLLSGMEEFDMGIKCARHIDDASVITVEVGGHNFNKEARLIEELVTSNFKIVGVDVQLPQLGCGTSIPFYAADTRQDYDLMKSSLRGMDTFQVTIGFMNAEGMLAYGRVWRFRLSSRADLAVAWGGNNAFVRPRQLFWLMASCGATHNPNVAWVTYQESLGIACLIKSFLAAADLPIDWSCYIKHQKGLFPNLYNVGLIAQGSPDIAGQPLGRNVAGAQALLVLRCYRRLAKSLCFPHIAEAVPVRVISGTDCLFADGGLKVF